MAEPTVTGPRKRTGKALGAVLGILAVPLLIALMLAGFLLTGGPIASPADVQGGPIRVAGPEGDRVYLLTSQWKTMRTFRTSSGSSYTDLLIDVWAFDAADARPVWRHRLVKDRRGVNMGRSLLGAQGGVLWALDGQGLVGLSLKDGAVVADAARIEAANPELAGLMPKETRYYRFGPDGLAFTAADGRAWRMAGEGLKALAQVKAADSDKPAARSPGVAAPARVAGGNGTWAFMQRGLNLQTRWLGLLSPEEVEPFRTGGGIGGIDPENHPRSRLWRATITSRSTFFGPKPVYSEFAPLPQSPEFLQAGLLYDGATNGAPILLFKPDSLLVLHRDRLGEAGRLQLSRVTGPAGKTPWTAALPLQAVEAVMPGETSVVLLGSRDQPVKSSKRPESVDHLVAIDLASGRMGVYGFNVKPTEGPDIPASSTAPEGS